MTGDGSGGWFINKTDRCVGPYKSRHGVSRALRGLKVRNVWWRQTLITADDAP